MSLTETYLLLIARRFIMRQFSSYGPIDKELHYYVPRRDLFNHTYGYLTGNNPTKGGHYFTVWAARQTGKSSLLKDVSWELLQDDHYHTANIDIQNLQGTDDSLKCMNSVIHKINAVSNLKLPKINHKDDFEGVFSKDYLDKPLILIIDEFDSLDNKVIHDMVGVFRNIYHARIKDRAPSPDKYYLLHSLALIGVRSVVGVDSSSGSPFNVQRSLQVHNLTAAEVREMYQWYEQETRQTVEPAVIEQIYEVTRGQPGLVSWFGELLTDKYNNDMKRLIDTRQFAYVYSKALRVEPNNYIINIISKAKTKPYRQTVLNLFHIDRKIEFNFSHPLINFLYMHGVVSYEEEDDGIDYLRFPGQFVQEKLFHFFAHELVRHHSNMLADPFTDLSRVINEQEINIVQLLKLYQDYYTKNRDQLREYAQRRVGLQVMEVVYHFQLFSWLNCFLREYGAAVLPEFPTGNGKIDLLIRHGEKVYGLELKSFSQLNMLNKSIRQASTYGRSLGLNEITLVVFLEKQMPDELYSPYASPFEFPDSSNVTVFFIITGP